MSARAAVVCGVTLLALAGISGADTTEIDPARLSVGVAPFETSAAAGAAVPDFATLLADRIGTRGVGRIVGPATLGASADPEPAAETVKAWAKEAEVDAVVVGRTTRIGNQLSVDVRLRSGHSGQTAGTYVAEVMRPDQLEGAVERLAGQVIEGVAGIRDAADARRAGRRGSKQRASLLERLKEREGDDGPFAFGNWDRNQPLSITSDELEATDKGGARSLLFKRNVRVTQGDMLITASTLRAVYPPSASQPDRLEANGGVKFVQGDRSARCDNVVYDRVQESLTCNGRAVLSDGENRLTGKVIEIDLRTERVKVKGGASVLIQPDALDEYQDEEKAQ